MLDGVETHLLLYLQGLGTIPTVRTWRLRPLAGGSASNVRTTTQHKRYCPTCTLGPGYPFNHLCPEVTYLANIVRP